LTRTAFPHSEIPGSKVVCTSPRLIAADHVFHRLSAPRHPPHTLTSLTTKPLLPVRPRPGGTGKHGTPWPALENSNQISRSGPVVTLTLTIGLFTSPHSDVKDPAGVTWTAGARLDRAQAPGRSRGGRRTPECSRSAPACEINEMVPDAREGVRSASRRFHRPLSSHP
jgi:hypothetical protein